ncbi:MAG: DUF4215 domain-containing protein [Bdellovibrionales bacterium]|nr:DUF4215 domain-containing protein [Bdellovibrionales bacterium]
MINNSSILCTNCAYGFHVDSVNNLCYSICGDSMIVSNETCDDGNVFNGDGCSSTCQIEPSFFCLNEPSECYPCLQYCLDCLDNSSCNSCNSLTLWNLSSLLC